MSDDAAELAAAAARATELAALHGDRFGAVDRYCLFIGYARSGHTLIGSLLDAHPEAVISNELDALRYVDAGFDRAQLFSTIFENARESADAGRMQTGYSYHVPGASQGASQIVRVIGDKKGGLSTRRLTAEPALLDRLRAVVACRVQVLHVTRNPYDNIARIHLRSGKPLERAVHRYFKFADRNAAIRARLAEDDLLELRLEAFIAEPRATLERIAAFFGLTCEETYLDAAAAVVFASPKRSRDQVEWPAALVDDVARRIANYPFLTGYSFDA